MREKAKKFLFGEKSPHLFNGKERDAESGLYYYGARYYDERTSLFANPDPLWTGYADVSTAAFCHGNPTNRIDPTGLFDTEDEAFNFGMYNNVTGRITERADGTFEIYDEDSRTTYYHDENSVLCSQLCEIHIGLPNGYVLVPRKNNPNNFFGRPDMTAIGLSVNFVVGLGLGADVKIGELDGGEKFVSITPKWGIGFDLGVSGEIETGYYKGKSSDFYANSLRGFSKSVGASLGIGMTASENIKDPHSKTAPVWTTMSYTAGADISMSLLYGYTFITITW